MMLQINLLPGGRKSASAAGGFPFADKLGGLAIVKDPWLLGAAASVVVSLVTVGMLFTAQSARAAEVATRVDRAVRDSTRYAKVLDARRRLTAERDSVYRQLQIIRTIDDNRYNWAHILDEVSRALPAYTWLTLLEQTSKAPVPPGALADKAEKTEPAVTPAAAAARKKAAARPDTVQVHPPLSFRLVGQTVDIQALTMFMRQLESSPFVQHVSLTKSEIVAVDGKDITQFELTADYEVPPGGVVKTAPLVVPVR
ncbi:MAG: PilN domain-containing protein [Gemmatimonadetes bacterium]|nr:PilN domain-containing protein [Gemmatimonadota bacterium]